MTLKFGTDGIRGRAYDQLTVDDVEALAFAAVEVLGGDAMVVGTDTRESGPDFVDALCRGLMRQGVQPWLLGDVPTPALARAAAVNEMPGAMVSASHNPFHDNGIKFFARGGRKLTDAQQSALEFHLETNSSEHRSDGDAVAPLHRTDLLGEYGEWVKGTLQGRRLDGLRVVVDCANGAASVVAPQVLTELGADVTAINDKPNGRNINDNCGSTYMDHLSDVVARGTADLGLAFDGDADRVLAVDSAGQLIDGDQIIAICAIDSNARGTLADNTVVVTVMTNLGFHHGMARHSIRVHQTQVGDRAVLEALDDNSWSLGGEQSGHVIFPRLATTGDGLLTAVQLLDAVVRSGSTLEGLAGQAMVRLPQRLRNVAITGSPTEAMAALAVPIEAVETSLGSTGRLLVRPSGTEPLIRVMAEAPTQSEADAAVDHLITLLEDLDL